MGIVLIRVDSRLIHGQILEAWIPYTKADALVVVDDEVEKNLLKRSVMEMAVPSSIEVCFNTVGELVQKYENGRFAKKKVIILFSNIQDARYAYDLGFRFETLNLGNMHFCEGKVQVSSNLCVGLDDTDTIMYLNHCGVAIDTRSVPGEKKMEVNAIVKKSKKG